MAAPTTTVGELIESLSSLDQTAMVSILLDEEDADRGDGIYSVDLHPDDSDGHVFLNIGRTRTKEELLGGTA